MTIDTDEINSLIHNYEKHNLSFHFHKYGLTMKAINLTFDYMYHDCYEYDYLSRMNLTLITEQFIMSADFHLQRMLENKKEEKTNHETKTTI